MSKGDITRNVIIERAAPIFNRKGYSGTSLADIMEATGLQKGGIYNHFSGKDDIALEAFEYSFAILRGRYRRALREAGMDYQKQLLALMIVFEHNVEDPPIAGGCPILNTAVDSDDTHPLLRRRARQALDEWRDTMRRIIAKGQQKGVFHTNVDGDEVATTVISLLEGATMMSQLYRDALYIRRAMTHVRQYLDREVMVRE